MAMLVKFLWRPMQGTWASCGRISVVSIGAKGLRASWQRSRSAAHTKWVICFTARRQTKSPAALAAELPVQFNVRLVASTMHSATAVHEVAPAATEAAIVVMPTSAPEAKINARSAVVSVSAVAATIAVATMAVTVPTIVHGLGELLSHAYAVRRRYRRGHGCIAEKAG
jgi:hypothetical protein